MRVRRGGPAGSPILQPARRWDPNLLAAPDVLAVIVLACSALSVVLLSIGVWLAVGWIAWSGQASRPSRLARAG
jgi:hypothetical protein